ncbi:MAG: hypothetical protein E6J41_33725, partial [Chloroflexi bacterium]
MTVWAYVEHDPEVMGDAADLAEELGAAAGAIAAGAAAETLAAVGAERVLTLAAPYDAEVHANAVAAAVGEPRAVLLAGTARGADLAPRLAARLGAACLLDCAWLRAGPAGLLVARWAHDDRALERWLVPAGAGRRSWSWPPASPGSAACGPSATTLARCGWPRPSGSSRPAWASGPPTGCRPCRSWPTCWTPPSAPAGRWPTGAGSRSSARSARRASRSP